MPRLDAGEKTPVDRLRSFQLSSQANKRCSDCVDLGTTYVCLDFQSFVCQSCSGIHREFGHKIKSISLSQWTTPEVEKLEGGGNDRDAHIWLGRWNPEECPKPDGGDIEGIRQFIKQKYVDKRWFSHKHFSGRIDAASNASNAESVPSANGVQLSTEQPAVAQKSDFNPQANIGDLLSGGSDVCAAPTQPLPSDKPSCPQAAVLPDTAAWTADFTAPDSKICTSAPDSKICTSGAAHSGAITGDLFDLDMGILQSTPTPPASKADESDATTKGGTPTGTDFDSIFDVFSGSAPCSNNLAKSVVAEPAEEPAPNPPAIAGDGADAASIADRMRQAVLNGSSDDLMLLYKQCSEITQPPKRALPDGRLAAYAAFDELGGGAAGSASQWDTISPATTPAAPAPSQMQTSEGVRMFESASAQGLQSLPSLCQPLGSELLTTGQTDVSQVFAPSVEQFFIGEDNEANVARPQRSNLESKPWQMPQLKHQPLSPVGLSPMQLEQMNPQELMQMQMMIQRALQAQNQVAPSPQPFVATRAATQGPVAASPWAAAEAHEELSPPTQFNDLITAFQEKHPVIGFEFA